MLDTASQQPLCAKLQPSRELALDQGPRVHTTTLLSTQSQVVLLPPVCSWQLLRKYLRRRIAFDKQKHHDQQEGQAAHCIGQHIQKGHAEQVDLTISFSAPHASHLLLVKILCDAIVPRLLRGGVRCDILQKTSPLLLLFLHTAQNLTQPPELLA